MKFEFYYVTRFVGAVGHLCHRTFKVYYEYGNTFFFIPYFQWPPTRPLSMPVYVEYMMIMSIQLNIK